MTAKFLVSVIIPVYNVEDYIQETVESVIVQDIGFQENVEIILVDDGSSDGSGVICRKYADKYPENIVYVLQKNSGVSEARNNGLRHASGEYIHFLDSDDLISKNTYRETISILSDNESAIDFAAIKIEFFDAKIGGHPLNYKFKETRVVDVNAEPSAVIMHMPTCVIRRSAISNSFVNGIEISEDSRFINEILLKKKSYAVVSNAQYYYRKRLGGGSAIDGSHKKISFYTVTPSEVYMYLMHKWGNHPYIQNLIAYDLQWRIRQKTQTVLTRMQETEYKRLIHSIVNKIESNIFIAQKSIGFAEKEYILRIKKDDKALEQLKRQYEKEKKLVSLDVVEFTKKKLKIIGHIPTGIHLGDLQVKIDGVVIKYTELDMFYKHNEFLGDLIYDGGGFSVEIPLTAQRIEFIYTNQICEILAKKHSRIPDIKNSYVIFGDKVIINNKKSLAIVKKTRLTVLKREFMRQLRILASLKLRYSAEELYRILKVTLKTKLPKTAWVRPFLVPLKSLSMNLRDLLIRNTYFIYRIFKRKPVWIISDRTSAGGDNGEALFSYLMRNSNAQRLYDIYFAVDKKADDYQRIKNIGNVVNRFSIRYKLLFLCADKIISSHAEDNIYNAFEKRYTNFVDLYKFDFIFLQHGITKDDLSSWINKYAKNVKLFITATPMEYKSIATNKYGYQANEVALTGFPRYDLLQDGRGKKLIIMPTWRTGLVPPLNQKTGTRDYSEEFKKSEFFKFYDQLIHDRDLHEALSRSGYTGEFYLHPGLSAQIADFTSSESISIMPFPHNYRQAFSQGSILLTDYSSVAFDFAYMKKPVVYTQFDEKDFFENQMYSKGYFSYKNDGLGVITRRYSQTVRELASLLENDAVMQKKYQKRVDSFFKYTDKKNSNRVYKAIHKLRVYGDR